MNSPGVSTFGSVLRMERTMKVRVDDFDHSLVAAATVRLSLDGRSVDLDLAQVHVDELVDVLAPWFDAGRPVRAKAQSPRGKVHAKRRVTRGPSQAKVRAWARANNVPVSNRGSISRDVITQYQAARKRTTP
jgi:hypothetical protein